MIRARVSAWEAGAAWGFLSAAGYGPIFVHAADTGEARLVEGDEVGVTLEWVPDRGWRARGVRLVDRHTADATRSFSPDGLVWRPAPWTRHAAR